MKRLILTACLCLLFFSVVKADPIVITSGLGYNNHRTQGTFQFSLQNADGSLSTNIQTLNTVNPFVNNVSALPGQPLDLLFRGAGNDIRGTFTYNGVTWFSFSTLEILASALAPTDMLPGVPVRVFGPFTFTGTLFGQDQPNPAIPPGQVIILPVVGTGVVDATVVFNGERYFVTSPVVYHFGVSEVPEPATMLLLATGLAGVAAKVRRRRCARQ